MNTQEQAFASGFVKRAMEYGLSSFEAIQLYKQAADGVAPVDKPAMDPFTANPFKLPPPTFKPAKAGDPGTAGMSAKALDARNIAQEMNARLGNPVIPLQAGTASSKPGAADLNDVAGYRKP